MGPLCVYSSNPEAESVVANCDSLLCNYEEAITPPASGCGASAQGNSFTWTPDGGTPDTVYYQVCVPSVCFHATENKQKTVYKA